MGSKTLADAKNWRISKFISGCFIALFCALQILWGLFVLKKLEVGDSPVSSQTLSTVFPTAFAHLMSLSHFGNSHNTSSFFLIIMLVIGEGTGTPLQYSCLENPMDGEV